jgi:hypothetical protein
MTPTASCLKKFRLELIAPRLSKLWEISYSIYGAKGVIKEEGSLFPMALFRSVPGGRPESRFHAWAMEIWEGTLIFRQKFSDLMGAVFVRSDFFLQLSTASFVAVC